MLLNVENLSITFLDGAPGSNVVEDFNLQMSRGEVVGVVGESGSGKSMTALAIVGLINKSRASISGRIVFDGIDIASLKRPELRQYQGREISIIFQEPMTSLNPTMKIGKQVEEALLIHTKMTPTERRRRALEAMRNVELSEPERLYDKYPHELSGGMRQRVMIASAIVLRPRLLVADEPTTALDLTIQAQIIKLLKRINREHNVAILFISHDLGVIKSLCSRVLVMHNGKIVEQGSVDEVFNNPREAYTKRLISSIPSRKKPNRGNGDD